MMEPGEAKTKFSYAVAKDVADTLKHMLCDDCVRIEIAGSLRRNKPEVGDIEIVYIPRIIQESTADLFETEKTCNAADRQIEMLIRHKILEKRKNAKGSFMYGDKNKLMRHCETGIPVDLFATTEDCWWNYLVCRTGPAESNIKICKAAQAKGWKWNPYSAGFSMGELENQMRSEAEVFDFVNLPYLKPEDSMEPSEVDYPTIYRCVDCGFRFRGSSYYAPVVECAKCRETVCKNCANPSDTSIVHFCRACFSRLQAAKEG